MNGLKTLVYCFASLLCIELQAQVKIGADLSTIDSSAVLEIESTTGGLLLPRLTAAQRNAIASPSAGLIIYNIDNHAVELSIGAFWLNLATGDSIAVNTNSPASGLGGASIGTATPNVNAVLDLVSSSRGLLPPRMTTIERNAILNPTEGLLIFNITDKCLQWHNGIGWHNACD